MKGELAPLLRQGMAILGPVFRGMEMHPDMRRMLKGMNS